jgi:hypothetical protein
MIPRTEIIYTSVDEESSSGMFFKNMQNLSLPEGPD